MKRILYLLLMLTCAASAVGASRVKFTVKGVAPREAKTIQVYDIVTHRPIATLDVVDGKFTYSGASSDDSYLLFYDSNSHAKNYVITDGENILLDMQRDKVSGTAMNDQLDALTHAVNGKYDKVIDCYNRIKQAATPEDVQAFRKKAEEAMGEANAYLEKVAGEHSKDCLPVVVLTDYYQYLPFEALARLCESKAAYTRHPAFQPVMRQFEKQQFNQSLIGKKYTNVTLLDGKGEKVKLSEAIGQSKYVLVDFWASWCGPCMSEMPYLKSCYEKYKDKGFEIVGISLDKDRMAWISAISKHNLFWKHYSDLKGWESSPAAAYNVRSIPWNFLCDPEGKIIAVSLRGEALENKLSELLK